MPLVRGLRGWRSHVREEFVARFERAINKMQAARNTLHRFELSFLTGWFTSALPTSSQDAEIATQQLLEPFHVRFKRRLKHTPRFIVQSRLPVLDEQEAIPNSRASTLRNQALRPHAYGT